MVRVETFIGIGKGEAIIQREHLVKQRGPRPPVSDNENGALPDFHVPYTPSPEEFLHTSKNRMEE